MLAWCGVRVLVSDHRGAHQIIEGRLKGHVFLTAYLFKVILSWTNFFKVIFNGLFFRVIFNGQMMSVLLLLVLRLTIFPIFYDRTLFKRGFKTFLPVFRIIILNH